ncbi:hypothetical protein HFE03_07885 [Paenibacillus sp. EKM102P]|uniref:hypothetical protein n=1 Tax=unclassified Paenibacillus TaxID=185978 RepID=UPI00142D60CA|nr:MULTISPECIES: hypothetical protein [unclassified Paenibacillus]KAF6620564.1 hypothetical protein HFE00_05790 [Paenibacillus sp. EKM101P]KAF6623556.1 hypothetical protein HFE03_07885 [Paenibacillus sp. EKM102P]KAF6633882.1 hypothetical protein HFE01_06625 [Paenibacillus sp. EKM10P]KAF6649408.1 hypothetical protein HFE02_01585 [Paenibacillus sp. EKM11P]
MPRPRVYKLFHTFDPEDLKIYFKTTMTDEHLIKLIKIWQVKLSNIVPEYDWGTEEMMELLSTFGCEQINENSGFRTYYEANLYDIWEYANTWPTDEEIEDPKYNNDNTQPVFDKVIEQNREVYKGYWMKWEAKNEERQSNKI